MRIIVYLGKGGVGKTSTSSATAVAAARRGERVLILSTDVAHSLADALGTELDGTPREIEKNLYAMEVNVLAEIRTNWSEIHSYFSTMLMKEGASEIVADELAVVPGMEEMLSLRHIWKAAQSGKYDTVIVDAAPTGETMRLFSLPESYRWYTEKVGSWHMKTIGFAAPLIQRFMPKKNIFKLMPEIGEHLKSLHGLLTDARVTTFRIVLNPENMVIKEALRAQTYLNLFGYTLDAVIVNKILPKESSDVYMQALIKQQQKYLDQITNYFYPVPIFRAPYYESEVIGAERLSMMGSDVFGTASPTKVFYTDKQTHTVEKSGNKYMLRLYLPNIEIDRVQMNVKGDELLIEVNNFRKNIVLPNVLIGRKTEGAQFGNGNLDVMFS